MLRKLGQNLFKILLSQTTLMKTSAFIPLHEISPHFQKSWTAEPKIAKNIPPHATEVIRSFWARVVATYFGGVGWDVLKQKKKKRRICLFSCFFSFFLLLIPFLASYPFSCILSLFFFFFFFCFCLLSSLLPLFIPGGLYICKAEAKAKSFLWPLCWRREAVMPFLAWDTDTLT